MKRRTMEWGTICSVFGVGMLLSGCAAPDRLAHANYERIQQNASTQSEVEGLLGNPTNKLGDTWIYERPDKHLTVMIDFDKNGKVERKQWIDGLGETWHDTKDTEKSVKNP